MWHRPHRGGGECSVGDAANIATVAFRFQILTAPSGNNHCGWHAGRASMGQRDNNGAARQRGFKSTPPSVSKKNRAYESFLVVKRPNSIAVITVRCNHPELTVIGGHNFNCVDNSSGGKPAFLGKTFSRVGLLCWANKGIVRQTLLQRILSSALTLSIFFPHFRLDYTALFLR